MSGEKTSDSTRSNCRGQGALGESCKCIRSVTQSMGKDKGKGRGRRKGNQSHWPGWQSFLTIQAAHTKSWKSPTATSVSLVIAKEQRRKCKSICVGSFSGLIQDSLSWNSHRSEMCRLLVQPAQAPTHFAWLCLDLDQQHGIGTDLCCKHVEYIPTGTSGSCLSQFVLYLLRNYIFYPRHKLHLFFPLSPTGYGILFVFLL